MLELAGKDRRFHSPSRARALHQRVQRCRVYAQYQRGPKHAFVADESHLEAGVTLDRSDQGDEATRGKKDVTNVLAGIAKYVGKAKLNLLAARQQILTILAGQSGEQTIVRGGPHRL